MSTRSGVLAMAAFALGVGLFLHTLLYSDAWHNRQRVRTDLHALQQQNAAAEERMEQLSQSIEALRTRPEVQERVIRQELGLVRSNEIVLELGAR